MTHLIIETAINRCEKYHEYKRKKRKVAIELEKTIDPIIDHIFFLIEGKAFDEIKKCKFLDECYFDPDKSAIIVAFFKTAEITGLLEYMLSFNTVLMEVKASFNYNKNEIHFTLKRK
jgi:hypothetical protein